MVALERARTLAVGSGRAGQSHSGSKVRVVFAPLAGRVLIDAVMLGEAGLADDLGMSIRMSGLIGHDMAMTHRLTADGVEFEAASARGFEQLHFTPAEGLPPAGPIESLRIADCGAGFRGWCPGSPVHALGVCPVAVRSWKEPGAGRFTTARPVGSGPQCQLNAKGDFPMTQLFSLAAQKAGNRLGCLRGYVGSQRTPRVIAQRLRSVGGPP